MATATAELNINLLKLNYYNTGHIQHDTHQQEKDAALVKEPTAHNITNATYLIAEIFCHTSFEHSIWWNSSEELILRSD